MVIKDWCIGCGQCANQCPYGAIQMYDTGVVPEVTHGWRFQLARAVTGPDWHWPDDHQDRTWATGCSPFHNDRDFQAELKRTDPGLPSCDGPDDPMIYFRLEFQVAAEVLRRNDGYRLEMSTTASELVTWVNGRKVELSRSDRARDGRWEFESHLAPKDLHRHRNLLAVQVIASAGTGDLILGARIDEVRRPEVTADLGEEIVQKLVTEHAVVCDLCSELSTGPACLSACPHDAALRIDVPARVLSAGLASEKRG
jgi:Fe-S-cluster-containing hydrogenase component 2